MISAALICLGLNIYFEARSQSYIEQVAVAQVVLNRVKDKRYPDTVCEVIYQGKHYTWGNKAPIKHQCGFSWYCNGRSDKPTDTKAWEKSIAVADFVMNGLPDLTEGATHYHATYVTPSWASSKTRIAQIGDSIFYRWERR